MGGLEVYLFVTAEKDKVNSEADVKVYLNGLLYDKGTSTITAVVGINGEKGTELDGVSAHVIVKSEDVDVFYIKYISEIKYNKESIFSAVENSLTLEQRNFEGVTYSTLKVNFSYATIYKSTKSDGVVTKSGKVYYHTYAIDNVNEDAFVLLNRESPYAAMWYLALGDSVAFVGILVLLVIIIKGKRNGKEGN